MSIIGAWPRSFCRMSIHRWPCFGIGAAYPGKSFPMYSSIAASVQSWQLVHSATSMIMFHLDIYSLQVPFGAGCRPDDPLRRPFSSAPLAARRLHLAAPYLSRICGEGNDRVLRAQWLLRESEL